MRVNCSAVEIECLCLFYFDIYFCFNLYLFSIKARCSSLSFNLAIFSTWSILIVTTCNFLPIFHNYELIHTKDLFLTFDIYKNKY